MKKSHRVQGNREVRAYPHLYHAAAYALDENEGTELSYYDIMTSLTFSAFTLEAYLNHVGQQRISYWSEIEKITPLQKLKVLYDIAKLPYDASKRPIQTANELFKFRNDMAHGKTEKLVIDVTVSAKEALTKGNYIQTRWEQYCNLKEAKRALEDIESIVEYLAKALDLEQHSLYIFGGGSHTITKL